MVFTFILELCLSLEPFFHVELPKIQSANVAGICKPIVPLRSWAAVVDHIPANFVYLKRGRGYAMVMLFSYDQVGPK